MSTAEAAGFLIRLGAEVEKYIREPDVETAIKAAGEYLKSLPPVRGTIRK